MSAAYHGPGNGKGSPNGSGSGSGPGRVPQPDIAALSDRLPPQNLEAERSVLGSILLDNDVLHEIIPILSVADFYRDAHQVIYQAIREMYDLGKAVDAVTLADELIRRDQFANIGGAETRREGR